MKKRLPLFGLLSLFISLEAKSQNNTQEYNNSNLRSELNEQMRYSNVSSTVQTVSQTNKVAGIGDTDNDGMPDTWETANGLNINDPKDAFADPDNDLVLNLFEYQLNANPKNNSTPVKKDVKSTDVIETEIKSAAPNTLLRIESGNYTVKYLNFGQKRIMLQGGWNNTFTTRTPDVNPTIFKSNTDDEILYFGISSTSTTSDTLSVVLDGLNFEKGKGTTAAINIIGQKKCFLMYSMIDCVLKGLNNTSTTLTSGAINLIHWDDCVADVTIARSIIANNPNANGIKNQTTENAIASWRLLNVDIVNNGGILAGHGYPISMFTLNSGKLDMSLTNNIIWGNKFPSINMSGSINVKANNSFLTAPILPSTATATFTSGTGISTANPLLTDTSTAKFDYNLKSTSTCIDAGVDVGLAYNGVKPDIGAKEFKSTVGINTLNNISELTIYPNPSHGGYINVRGLNENVIGIDMYNSLGEKLFTTGLLKNQNNLSLDFSKFSKGVYFLQINETGKIRTEKIIID